MVTQDLLIIAKGDHTEAIYVEAGKRFAELCQLIREKYDGFTIQEWLPAKA